MVLAVNTSVITSVNCRYIIQFITANWLLSNPHGLNQYCCCHRSFSLFSSLTRLLPLSYITILSQWDRVCLLRACAYFCPPCVSDSGCVIDSLSVWMLQICANVHHYLIPVCARCVRACMNSSPYGYAHASLWVHLYRRQRVCVSPRVCKSE